MARLTTLAEWEALEGDEALTEPERHLIDCCRDGIACTLGDGNRPEGPDPARTIRAELLRYLILGGCDGCRVAETGVRLRGAYVSGVLDLNFATAKGPTAIEDCRFEQPISALQTRFEFLELSGSALPGLMAQSVQVAGSIVFERGFHADGGVSLTSAKIGGQLVCRTSRFENPQGGALNAHGAEVTGGVFLGDDFHAIGAVSLAGAKIGGQLLCSKGRFNNPNGHALLAESAIVNGSVFLDDGFQAKGEVSLLGSKIGGQLNCSNGRFENPGLHSLSAQSAEVTGGVFLNNGFTACGSVILLGARIGRTLSCSNGQFKNPGGDALNAQGAEVTGNVSLNNDFYALGCVSFAGGKILGQLICTNGHFENLQGHALNLQGAEVTDGAFLNNDFQAKGDVSLAGAKISGDLTCSDGHFLNPEGFALLAHGTEVTGNVFLNDGFEASGRVSLAGAKIFGQLSCRKGRFGTPNGSAFLAQRMQVGAGFIWQQVNLADGVIDLSSAHVGDLTDDTESWPEGGRVILNGFTYDRISGASTDAKTRLAWLAKGDHRDGEFFPQPYTQLAKVLREMGHDRAARKVLMTHEQLVRRHIRETALVGAVGKPKRGGIRFWNLLRWLWDFVLRWVTGYGHAPEQSVLVLTVLFLIATCLASRTWNEGSFAPNSDVILTSPGWAALASDPSIANPADAWSANGAAGQDWETFNRYAYGFDLVVPILTLGQTSAWAPSASRGCWGYQLWWARWVLESLGWVVTALGAAAITGIIRRD